MTDQYEEFERRCKKIREENAVLLKEFKRWLQEKGLSDKTIRKHVSNTEFYINHCLCYDDPPQTAAEGVGSINYFLGYWFIRKAIWASPASIRENAASLKKFYAFMAEMGYIKKDDFEELRKDIKEGLPEWLSTVSRYDDPNVNSEEVW